MNASENQLRNLKRYPQIPMTIDRIKSNIVIDANGCWIWQKCIGNTGYGNLRHLRKTYTLHRLTYELINGVIPKKMHVLHRCDVRACCNPDHLLIGSNLDNIKDSVLKNRRKGITRIRPSGLIYKKKDKNHV